MRRILLLAGAAGPTAFTAAWVVSSLRQRVRPVTYVQISGLAAGDARDPWIMIAGFLALGGSALVFGSALRDELGGRRAGPAPRLIQVAGLFVVATALARRDHMLLTPGAGSWHNQAHDVLSAFAYTLLVLAPLMLALRLRGDTRLHDAAGLHDATPPRDTTPPRGMAPLLGGAAVSAAAILVAFATLGESALAGALQRLAVSLPLAAIAVLAARLTAPQERWHRASPVPLP